MSFYRCGNEYGPDPCDFALENRKISSAEAVPAMDGSPPKCPGKTRSGKTCGSNLIPIPDAARRRLPKSALAAGGGLVGILALAVLLWLAFGGGGKPSMRLEAELLVFPKAEGGASSASIRIENQGKGDLVVDQIQTSSPQFVPTEQSLTVEPGSSAILQVSFKSASPDMAEGELRLHSNDPSNPQASARLIANRNPWWVYQKLETSSKTLRTEP